jgi:hypothetical protein
LKNREELCKDKPEDDSYCNKVGLTITSYFPEDTEGNYIE